MNETPSSLSANKQALLKIRELKQQVQQLTERDDFAAEPVAVVSMACRFPQTADTPEKFWQSLIRQDDLVSDVPEDRWDLDAFHDEDPEAPGKMYARKGVFLKDLSMMDPEFFGISPREATWVDPQQRLLMEVGWEAIERAGWIPEQIADHTGVFVGWMHNDYQNEASDSFLNLNPYIATGAAGSFLCGRLAWHLGLRGPSLAVDTACSSSLVALHLAIQSLARRDCDRALVGGVNAICSPTTNILTCKLKALSPSGHSRAFDAAADGYLRGEGCGVITLRRLSDAQRDGDKILGVIRGSAIGHNGAGSGLTVPNPRAQEDVIRKALDRAGLESTDVDYLEAHGTGTSLGDPIEVNAAAAAYCSQRQSDDPLLIGSVKTNIGHLEAAAGMAGLIKVLLSLQNGSIPGQMNFETPNPHIAWDKIPVKVLTEETTWPRNDRRRAGVSAFGMSGTNAHVILEAPENVLVQVADDGPTGKERSTNPNSESNPLSVITISGKSKDALYDLADSWADALSKDAEFDLASVASQSNLYRSHFDHRAAIVAADQKEAVKLLQSVARGSSSDRCFIGTRRRKPRVAWQFTGQGCQYVGMGRQLYQTEPVYRKVIDDCDQQLRELRSGSLLQVLFENTTSEPKINDTHWTQPAIFALQQGLVKLLQSWGLGPDLVMGHSVGQYAAACVAGIMTWEQGLHLIAERGRLIGQLPAGGLMLAVFAPLDAIQSLVDAQAGVSIAALNGTHIVVSGEAGAVAAIESTLETRGVKTKRLTTSHAFHSQLMDPALEPFAAIANKVNFQTPQMPLICNVSGKVLAADRQLDGQYWADHIRSAVAYAPSLETLDQQGCDVLLEIGPNAVLSRMAAAKWQGAPGTLIGTLQKDLDDVAAISKTLAQVYVQVITPNFRKLHRVDGSTPPAANHRIDLPTYPFQRRRFWGPDKPRAAHAEFHTAHPLLGAKISLAGTGDEVRYESFIDTDSPAWLPDHSVMDAVVLPGAALIEMAIEAAGGKAVENIIFEQPIRPSGRTALQTVIRKSEDDPQKQRMEVFARAADGQNWVRHFACDFVATDSTRPAAVDLQAVLASATETESPELFYEKMNELGLNYGPVFQCIQRLNYSAEGVVADLQLASDVLGFNAPPPMIDAALHALAVGLLRSDDDHLFLPVGIGRVEFYAPIETEAVCHAKWIQNEGKNRSADLTILSKSGEVLVAIKELKVQQVSLSALRQMSGSGAQRLVYDLHWKPTRLPAATVDSKRWLLVRSGDDDVFASKVRQRLSDQNHHVEEASPQQLLEMFPAPAGERQTDDPDQASFGFDGLIWLAENETSSLGFDENCQSLVSFVQAMIKRQWRQLPCGLLLLTRGAISAGPNSSCDPQQTQLWGLGRVISAEQPQLRCRLLDLDLSTDQIDEQSVEMVAELAVSETEDNQYVLRDGQLLVPRMQQTRLPKTATFDANDAGCYLITGGLGKLGRQAAKWLATRGARQVVLVSRRQPNEEAQAFIQTIEDAGCEVIVHAADMSQRANVETLFAKFGNNLKKLAGVIHAAGVVDDGLLESQTKDRFEKVLGPKVAAASLLHELTQNLDLDLFVLYSSAASVLGSPGQSNYATGNAFLDGLAWQRRATGLPAISINWGPWTEGMADDQRLQKRLALQGITPLTVEESHFAMEKLIASDTVQATVMDVDWRKMRIGPSGDVPPMLQELVGKRKKGRGADSAFVSKLRSLRGAAQRDLLMKTIQDSLQQILATPEAPETDRPLIEMGLDSLMAVEFGTELQQMLGDQFNVGPTMLFDHPTIDSICDHVSELVVAETSADSGETETAGAQSAANSKFQAVQEDIAVVGMSCRFPGADNIHEFWQNLLNGVDSVRDVPNDRWDVDRFYSADREPGKMYTREGGFLDDIADFDASFFNISDQEACWIDPQHRMLLENSYHAMEDAGIPTSPLADKNVGVFMGLMGSDYAFLPTLDDDHVIQGFQGAGLSHSAGVGRISFLFGFEGPSVAVDTASSSSLVAVYQAMRSLQEGTCNMALAGGVNAILVPVNSLLMSKAGLLSPDGRCKSFSQSADGFGRGEGCGVVVLKRLSDAERDGDRIMAVLRGGAVVHNGFSSGITSPSGKAQTRVISAAIKDAGIAPSQVQYLEAHGTGTEYGDPMEINAAMKVYGKGRKKQDPLLVGSVKANISHLEAAGGSSGLIKTILALHHGLIPQQIHFDEPSAHVPWKRMPAKVITENTPWPECERRTAGITALGLVGTNAHLVLSAVEEQKKATPAQSSGSGESNGHAQSATPVDEATDSGRQLLVASSRCEKALQQLRVEYADWLEQHPDVDLTQFCRTVATGRRHYQHRIAIPFESREQAVATLRDAAADNPMVSTQTASSPRMGWLFNNGSADDRELLRELAVTSSVVREFLQQCHERLENHSDGKFLLHDQLSTATDESTDQADGDTVWAYLLQASYCKLWRAWGIEPDVCYGVGVGQYLASASAGCVCFFDALVLVYQSQQIQTGGVSDDALLAFEQLADQFNFYPPSLPLWCSLDNEIVPIHRSLGGSYWRRHLESRDDVDWLTAVIEGDFDLAFALSRLDAKDIQRIETAGKTTLQMPESKSTEPTSLALNQLIGQFYLHGCELDFDTVFASEIVDSISALPLSLPTYPFQRKRYWITEIAKFMDQENLKEIAPTLS